MWKNWNPHAVLMGNGKYAVVTSDMALPFLRTLFLIINVGTPDKLMHKYHVGYTHFK